MAYAGNCVPVDVKIETDTLEDVNETSKYSIAEGEDKPPPSKRKKVAQKVNNSVQEPKTGNSHLILQEEIPANDSLELSEDEYSSEGEERLSNSSEDEVISKEVQCYFCSEMMLKNKIKEHMLKTHGRFTAQKYGPPRPYKCHSCNASLVEELKDSPRHVCFIPTKPRKRGDPIKCEICGHTFERTRKLMVHMQTVHSDHRPFECTSCDYKAKTNFALTNHIRRIHNKEKNVVCGTCGETFFDASDLWYHERNRHRPKLVKTDWPCDTCGKMFDTKRSMAAHKRFHFRGLTPTVKLPCETCGQVFPNKWIVTDHIRWEHPSQDAIDQLECICQKCNVNFSRAQILNEHLAQCLDDPKCFECQACVKSEDPAAKRSDYVWHSAISLKKHVAEEHRVIRTVCDICGKVLKTKLKTTLEDHKRSVHDGIKEWTCEVCGKTYGSKAALHAHVLSVHEDRKFNCNHCGKVLKSRDALVNHVASIHEQKVEFNCNLCEHKTFSKSALQSHIKRVHEKSLPTYPCTICNKNYYGRKRLSQHMNRFHGADM